MAINNLKSAHLVIASAWAIHAISWFLPVVNPGRDWSGLIDPVPGWLAFLAAIWPGQDFHADFFWVLLVASAATTFLFIVGSLFAVWRGSRSVRRVSAWGALTAFVFNSHWFTLLSWINLSAGYFLWWLSFGLLAGGLFMLSSSGAA